MIKLLANENFPLASGVLLKNIGYDIKLIGTDYHGIKDEEVINLSNTEQRLILTFDSDYGELIFKHKIIPLAGVLYLRLQEYTPAEPAKIIHDLISNQSLSFGKTLTVLERNGIRQRKYK